MQTKLLLKGNFFLGGKRSSVKKENKRGIGHKQYKRFDEKRDKRKKKRKKNVEE